MAGQGSGVDLLNDGVGGGGYFLEVFFAAGLAVEPLELLDQHRQVVRCLVKDRLGQAVEILGLLVAVQLGQARHFQVADGFRQFLLLGFFVPFFVGIGFLFVGLGQNNPQGDGVTARLFAGPNEVAVALAVVDRAEQQIAGRGGAGQRLGLGDVEPRLVAPAQGARAETAPAGQRVVGVAVELERHLLGQFVVEV